MQHSKDSKILLVIGMPLTEKKRLPEEIQKKIDDASIVIGESRTVTERRVPTEKKVFFLDNLGPREEKELFAELQKIKAGECAVLFSDVGHPILFDPGSLVLNRCRSLGFEIHSVPGPTSFGTAMAMCGWDAPFLLHGFLPRKTEEREEAIQKLRLESAHLVLLETPYRFSLLVKELSEKLPKDHEIFVAWEIGNQEETYLWTTAGKLASEAEKRGWKKGEFVVILKRKG